MTITTICHGCGKTLAVADQYAGRQARCPQCGQIYTVPGSTESSAGNSVPIWPADSSPGSSPSATSRPSIETSAFGSIPATPSPAPLELASSQTPGLDASKYWMKASDGTEYGPVDSATLARWFSEDRVGRDYQIRKDEFGMWQPAAFYQPAAPIAMPAIETSAANPYAAQSTYAVGSTNLRTYVKSDQSGLVLAMGILSWLGMCPIFGIIAWVVGSQALADIHAGHSDPANRGLVQLGYYLGIINVVSCVGCGGFFVVLAAFS